MLNTEARLKLYIWRSRLRRGYRLSAILPLMLSACTAEPPTVSQQATPATITPPTATVTAATATPATTTVPPITPTDAPAATVTVITATTSLAPLQPLQSSEIVDRPLRNMRALTDGTVKYKTAAWSPGAEWIAAVPQDGPGLYAIDTRSGETRAVVTDTFVLEPVWEDAQTLLVHQVGEDGDRLVRWRLAEQEGSPEILLTESPPIQALGAAGGNITFATDSGQLYLLRQSSAQQIAFPFAALVTVPAPQTQSRPTIAVNPHVANLEAVQTVLIQITDERVTSTPVSAAGEGLWLPRWAPDGAKLALTSIEGRIVSSPVDGASRFDLGPGDQPAWSPDSTRIAYAGASAGREFISRNIHLVDWRGQTARIRLTQANDEQFFTSPSWSPDGRRLAFVEIDDGKIYVGELP